MDEGGMLSFENKARISVEHRRSGGRDHPAKPGRTAAHYERLSARVFITHQAACFYELRAIEGLPRGDKTQGHPHNTSLPPDVDDAESCTIYTSHSPRSSGLR